DRDPTTAGATAKAGQRRRRAIRRLRGKQQRSSNRCRKPPRPNATRRRGRRIDPQDTSSGYSCVVGTRRGDRRRGRSGPGGNQSGRGSRVGLGKGRACHPRDVRKLVKETPPP